MRKSAGIKDSYVTTFQVDGDRETGADTVKMDMSFIVHPNKIKKLGKGKVFFDSENP